MVAVAAVTARAEVLARIRASLADVPADEHPEDVAVPASYLLEEPGDPVEQFIERISDYGVHVHLASPEAVARTVAAICRSRGVHSLAVPDDLPPEWRPDQVRLARTSTPADLETIDGALTGCAAAIAATGTLVLDHGKCQGPRALTLVPDFHLCVVYEQQILGGVPEAAAAIARTLRESPRPITLISGPSATSDIELSRVEGVHGPRMLDVILVRRDASEDS